MRLIKMILFVLPSMLTTDMVGTGITKNSVLVCYGRLEPETIKGYTYVILESQYYNMYEIQKIKSQNEKVVAYISLGEVNANSRYFDLLKENSFGKNEIWNSYYLNLKSEKAIESLKEIIRNTLAMGYDGMFFDNVENFSTHGPQSQQRVELVNLLKDIDSEFPTHFFIQNSGIQLIDDSAPYVDAVVMESVATNYTFEDKNYKLRNETEYKEYIKELKSVRKKYHLPIILIEYADSITLHDAIQKRIKSSRFDYFIGNINLLTMPQFSN
ncbi:endo alpha-1,4 polygalactosaminidase [Flavobacterium sp. GT3R68]|nr:hypothetical protein EKL32_15180 [Flavobacterium sp. GSN2]TRW91613.1 endo alpha-1,4 polygalactosaminidase [Flavobacterium sp. GT3R68]